MIKILKWLGLTVIALLFAVAIWLYIAPPELIRVAANYSAKIVCSNVFLANRDPQEVLKIDVQAPGHPILTMMNIEVDRTKETVHAGLFGLFGGGLAVHRTGFGCTAVPDGDLSKLPTLPDTARVAEIATAPWPVGNEVHINNSPEIAKILNDDVLAGPGVRAIVVVKNGRIIGERYADGFSNQTPLLGWSMAKTVTAGLIGRMIKQERIKLNSDSLFSQWNSDERKKIKLSDLMGMASDLNWNEGYGTVSDVTRLLYLEPDMVKAVFNKQLITQDGSQIGKVFNYSSGTTVAIARYLKDQFEDNDAAWRYPREELFAKLGMNSAVLETDSRGNLVGGSYVYATANDWARYGQFLLQNGKWNGEQLLPDDYVAWMTKQHPSADVEKYGQGQIWLRPPGSNREGDNPSFSHKAFWLAGHDGQSIAILPDENLVIVRLGLTPSKLLYKPAKLTNAIVEATR